MNVYTPVIFKTASGATIVAQLLTNVTLPTDFWTLTPANNGELYSGFPAGNPPSPTWSTIPNVLNRSTAYSVNVLTTYLTPTSGVTCIVQTLIAGVWTNSSLPAGWSFNGTTWAYDGTTVNSSPSSIRFIATLTSGGAMSTSNVVSIQGVGSPTADTFAPTVPVGATALSVTATAVQIGVITPSDPNPHGFAWSGLQKLNVKRTPPGSVIGNITAGPGNQPILALADIGPQTSTITQTGADISFTTNAVDAPFPTVDSFATGFQQLTGTNWTVTTKVPSFTATGAFSNLGLYARASMDPTAAFVGILTTPAASGNGFISKFRSALGGSQTNLQSVANSASPAWLSISRNGDTYTMAYSLDSNSFLPMGSVTQSMGATIYVGAAANSSDGSTFTSVAQQLSIQTLGNSTYTDSTVEPSTGYVYALSSQDAVPNVSAYGANVSVTTPSSGGGGGITFTPGLMPEDPTQQAGYGPAWAPPFGMLTSIGSEPSYVPGIVVELNWGCFEQTQGTYDFTLIDYCMGQAITAGKQLAIYLRYEGVPFGTVAQYFASQYFPAYLNDAFGANVFGGALPIYFGTTLGGAVVCMDRPAVANAFSAMFTAMANHVVSGTGLALKNHPNFEGVIMVETSYNLVGTTTQTPVQPNWPADGLSSQAAWDDAYVVQYNRLGTALRAAFPNKLGGRRANWGTNANMIAIAQNSVTNALALDNTDGPTDYCNMDDCIRGILPGSTDLRNAVAGNAIPLFCFSESVGINNGGYNITAASLISLAKDPTQWCANYLFPARYSGDPWVNSTWAQIKTAYAAQGGQMQTVKPTSYP